jgi:sensor domain CHASE-containing protein
MVITQKENDRENLRQNYLPILIFFAIVALVTLYIMGGENGNYA